MEKKIIIPNPNPRNISHPVQQHQRRAPQRYGAHTRIQHYIRTLYAYACDIKLYIIVYIWILLNSVRGTCALWVRTRRNVMYEKERVKRQKKKNYFRLEVGHFLSRDRIEITWNRTVLLLSKMYCSCFNYSKTKK